MNFANVKSITIPQGNVVEVKVGGVSIWKKEASPSNLFNLNDRVESKSFAKAITTTFASAGYTFTENEYVYPIRNDGRVYARTNNNVTNVVQSEGAISFTANSTYGVGFPFILDPNKSYRISANETTGTAYRLRIIYFDSTGIVKGNTTYSEPREDLIFNGFDGWTLISFESAVAGGNFNFTDIVLKETTARSRMLSHYYVEVNDDDV